MTSVVLVKVYIKSFTHLFNIPLKMVTIVTVA